MAVTTEAVRDLVDFQAPEGFLVTSFYLNISATEFPDPDSVGKSVDSLIHDARQQNKDVEEGLSHDATESLRADLERIREFVTGDLDRTDTNGIAIFCCSHEDFFEAVPMAQAVENRVVVSSVPYVSPIAAFLSHSKPTAILLTDRQQARIITMSGGDVREWTAFEDAPPQQRTQVGGWSQARYQRRSDNWAKHHVDHAAELVLKLLQHYPFDWLILGYGPENQSDLESSLHPYLKDRVIGRISVRVDADLTEVIEKAEELREQVETTHIGTLMEQVQEFAGAGGRGAIGLPATLAALNEQRVHIMLLQEGLHAHGSVCTNCGLLMVEVRDTCEACNQPARTVDDIYEAAVQRALELGATVEVATEFEQLLPIENIGAILFY